MTSYTIHVPDPLWELFKEKVPHSKTLDQAINELIEEKCNYKTVTIKKKEELSE